MKAVIVLPTYNEKGNIDGLIPLLEKEILPKIKNYTMEILIADDNSPDGTAKDVKKMMIQWKNIALITGVKKGLGAAYFRAIQYAIEKMHADVLVSMDADLSHDPHKIPQFLEKIGSGYDIVVATRYSKGGSIPSDWGFHRKFLSVFGNVFIQTIFLTFSVHDWTGSFRAFTKEVFEKEKKFLAYFPGNTFLIVFLHKAIKNKFKITEIPIAFIDRKLGKSKIVPTAYMVDAIKYILQERLKELGQYLHLHKEKDPVYS